MITHKQDKPEIISMQQKIDLIEIVELAIKNNPITSKEIEKIVAMSAILKRIGLDVIGILSKEIVKTELMCGKEHGI